MLLAHVMQPHATVRQMVWYASPYQRQDRAYGYARQLLGLMLLSQSADVFHLVLHLLHPLQLPGNLEWSLSGAAETPM